MTIHSHIYARREGTSLYLLPSDNANVVQVLHQGDWLGILSRQGEWIQVIGVEYEGWVKSSDVENRPPFELHIHSAEGKPMSYINVPSNQKSNE